MNFRTPIRCLALLALQASASAAFSPEQLRQLPPPASHTVDFNREIRPILEASCVKCHGRGKSNGGFQLDTRATFLQPGDSGPAILPGDSRNSLLIHLVAALDPDDVMPQKGSRLTPEQVGLLRAWIDQGLRWDSDVSFAREPHRNLTPRRPELPPASGDITHPVDRLVWNYFQSQGFRPPASVDDRTFARRVHLDTVGLLPTPEELDAFLNDPHPEKRQRLVRKLLSDDSRFAQNWMTFWNDLLRNDYRGTGYIDGGREQITRWLYSALRDNLPYDRFVRDLVNPGDSGPRGFTKGIVWRGAVNASQTPQLQAAQNISQVFLGVNLKCASCHDSFIDDWQLADAYGMAGVYADEKLELVRCDKPLGKHAPVQFLFPEIGAMNDDDAKPQRIARLAELVTHPANGRLPRTIVNRLWAHLLGRGLVEPLDVMQNPAWLPDLLDWLAEDLVAHQFNLRHTLERILTSRTYQLPAVDLADSDEKSFAFRGPAVRRLNAEQFRDALGQLTGTWYDKPEGGIEDLLFQKGAPQPTPASAFWIWPDPHAAEGVPPQTAFFRKHLDLPALPTEAVAIVHADNSHRLWVNGRSARKKNDLPWSEPSLLDLRPFLKPGLNTFAVEVVNGGDAPNPAGLLFYARLRIQPSIRDNGPDAREQILDFASDASWLATTNAIDDWHKAEFQPRDWNRAQTLGPAGMAPWNLGSAFASAVAGTPAFGRVRASLVAADALTTALGRPNREQVTSHRSPTATTIQMLELTNGEALSRILKQGASHLAQASPNSTALVQLVFRRALGRPPSPDESSLCLALVGSQPDPSGIEDLLWSVAMLPEFQLIF